MNQSTHLIKEFEGCKLVAYKCPAGVWTIGIGSTDFDGKPVHAGLVITQEQADAELAKDLVYFERVVAGLVKVPLNPNQLGALTSLVFNIGREAFRKSTMLRLLNHGDYAGASLEFRRWVFANGKILKGLVRRRNAERILFDTKP